MPYTTTAETLMEIPTVVFNLSESYISGHIAIPAPAALNTPWWYTKGMPLISEVDLYTRSGIYLCQLPNFQNYMELMRPIHTPMGEYLTSDITSFLSKSGSNVDEVPAITPNNGPGYNDANEFAYCTNANAYGNVTIGANPITVPFNFPLKAIKKTIFAMNKDFVFPDILVLRILWGPGSKFVWQGTSATDPNLNAAVLVGSPNIPINDLQLMLAVEKNEDLAQSVRALVNSPSGLNVLIDFPWTFKNSLNGPSQNISLRFNRGHGKNLLEIVSAPYNANEDLAVAVNAAYDHFNVTGYSTPDHFASAGAKVQTIYSQLDNVRLQDINLTCGYVTPDDFREMRKYMNNTPLLDMRVFNQNFFFMDKFYETSDDENLKQSNLDKGMSLIVERLYQIFANTTNTNYKWYSFAIVQRDLHIGSQSIAYQ